MEPDVSAEDIAHLEALAVTLRRRLRVIETQCAGYGPLAVPPHLIVEKEDAEQQLARILARLDKLRDQPTDSRNPYLGLLTFHEEDADRFFGRDVLVADLVGRAGRATFLAVLGASGSGKSSVVRAGLVPLLKGGALPGSEHWRYITLRPGARPLDALAVELAKLSGDPTRVVHYAEILAQTERALLLLSSALLAQVAGQRLVLVLDQAEELWTLTPSDPETQAAFVSEQQRPFLKLLLTAIAAPDAPLLVVLTLRADFLHRVTEQPALAHAIAEHDVIVSPMAGDELLAAIERPAELVGGSFEPGLVDELVTQTLGRVGALPLLEYTLQELWKRRELDGTMTWVAYRALGGIEGALAARADAILAERYTPNQQDDLRRLLLRLIQPGEGAADTRRRVSIIDLVPVGGRPDTVQTLLQPLTDERLLTTTGDHDDQSIELSHEALIRAWPTLGRWIADARADLRFQLQLEDAAREWQASGENADLLWSGLRLAQAEAWLARAAPQLNSRDQTFLDTSRMQVKSRAMTEEATRQREQQQSQRLRQRAVLLGIMLVVSLAALVGAAMLAIQLRERAADLQEQLDTADSLRLVDLARNLLDRGEEPETALLLAYEAVAYSDNAQSQRTVRQALSHLSSSQTILSGHTDSVLSVAWNPDGQSLITTSADHTARLWDVQGMLLAVLIGDRGSVTDAVWSFDGQRVATISTDKVARIWDKKGVLLITLSGHSASIQAVAWSPDGQRIITASDDATARIWKIDGTLLATLAGHTGSIYDVAWSPDGQRIVTASDDATARIWKIDGTLLATLAGHTGPIYDVAWSPDGQWIVTASDDKTVRMWDSEGAFLRVLTGHTKLVSSVAWSPDSKKLVSTSADNTAILWASDGSLLTILKGHYGFVISAVWSPDGRWFITTADDIHAILWDANGNTVTDLYGHNGAINSAAWSPTSRRIATVSADKTARLWDVVGDPLSILSEKTGQITSVRWSPDAQRIMTTSSNHTARVWDGNQSILLTAPNQSKIAFDDSWSPNSQRVVVASDETTATIWNVKGEVLATLRGTARLLRAIWSPDSNRILTLSNDQTISLWDTSGNLIAHFSPHAKALTNIIWSPDSNRILTLSNDQTISLWDTSGNLLTSFSPNAKSIADVIWSPDGSRIAILADKVAQMWSADGELLVTLEGHTDDVYSATWSPDGKRIVTTSDDNTARIWDFKGKLIAILTGHTSNIYSAAWSPDGKEIVTTSADNTARIWDVDGTLRAVLSGHSEPVFSATWSPDGSQFATLSDDKTLRIWSADGHLQVVLDNSASDSDIPIWSPTGRSILVFSIDHKVKLYLVHTEDILAVAACQVRSGLTEDDIQRFQVRTPLKFDFSKRQCPPSLGN